jgi:PAT family beta-lactamase induction signal transducer AmpG
MYAAQAFELGSTGLGSGAFGVLLLRLTQKRFSATQYALLSSLFTIPRVLAGPPAGLLADTIGWRDFFILTVFTGIPGLMFLHRFVPWGVREPEFHVVAEAAPRTPLSRPALLSRALLGGGGVGGASILCLAGLEAIRDVRAGRTWEFARHVRGLLLPGTPEEGLVTFGVVVVALGAGLATAATLVARGAANAGMNTGSEE